jgi:hypothetical protein
MIPKQLQEFAVALAFHRGRGYLEVFIFTARGKFQARRKNSRFFLSTSKANRHTGRILLRNTQNSDHPGFQQMVSPRRSSFLGG